MTKEESEPVLSGYKKFDPSRLQDPKGQVFQWDPSTMNELGPPLKAMNKEEVTKGGNLKEV